MPVVDFLTDYGIMCSEEVCGSVQRCIGSSSILGKASLQRLSPMLRVVDFLADYGIMCNEEAYRLARLFVSHASFSVKQLSNTGSCVMRSPRVCIQRGCVA